MAKKITKTSKRIPVEIDLDSDDDFERPNQRTMVVSKDDRAAFDALWMPNAYVDGYMAAKDNMQRVVHPNIREEYHDAWLAGYDGKDYEYMTVERVEMSIIRF